MPGDCLTVRLKGPDSSISALMGCRSSEAETTGNSKARRQPKRTNERERDCLTELRAHADWRRQMRTAGSANISHRMLRSSSILRVLIHVSSKVAEIVPVTFGRCRIEISACDGESGAFASRQVSSICLWKPLQALPVPPSASDAGGSLRGCGQRTSAYGADAYAFANDEPITLLNGGEMLGLLRKHGYGFRINLQEARQEARQLNQTKFTKE